MTTVSDDDDDKDHVPHKIGDIVEGVLTDLRDRPKRCFVEGGSIVFRDLANYDIPLNQCDTYEKILRWQLQLSTKQGMTLDLLMQFTLMACEIHRLPPGRR